MNKRKIRLKMHLDGDTGGDVVIDYFKTADEVALAIIEYEEVFGNAIWVTEMKLVTMIPYETAVAICGLLNGLIPRTKPIISIRGQSFV